MKTDNNTHQEQRRKALEWWDDLSILKQAQKCIKWDKSKNPDGKTRRLGSLSGREIEEIWMNELHEV